VPHLEELSERMISIRAIKNMTQKELAKEIGISRESVQSIESKNTKPRPVTRRKIELYLDNN